MILTLLPSYSHSDEQKRLKKEGELIAKESVKEGLKFAKAIDPNDLLPASDRGKKFDPQQAREKVLQGGYSAMKNNFPMPKEYQQETNDIDEEFLARSNSITDKAAQNILEIVEQNQEESLETCFEADAPFKLTVEETLKVDVTYTPPNYRVQRSCTNHEKRTKHSLESLAKEDEKNQKKQLQNDPTIKSYSVKIEGGGLLSKYEVVSKWTHHNDSPLCNTFRESRLLIDPEKWEESDTWLSTEQHPDISNPNCSLSSIEPLESNVTKTINGKDVFRPCWGKRFHYIIRHPSKQGCDFLRYKNCLQSSKRCAQTSEYGCSLWELTFQCATKLAKRAQSLQKEDLYGHQDDLWDTSYEPNTSLPEVVTKLKVFEELKLGLEASGTLDTRSVQLFGGKKTKCSKSVAENLLYDCCFSLKGLSNQLKLSKCDADEIALADMRDRGHCTFIGSYDTAFLDLWKSRKEHVYCCFPSKLSRVFQEQSRKQLRISWGTPEKPDCRGLSQQEISRLNFSTMDLSEAYEAIPHIPTDFSEKIKEMEEKLKNRLSNDLHPSGGTA